MNSDKIDQDNQDNDNLNNSVDINPLVLLLEFPINSLNFCNVDVYDNYLCCINSINDTNFNIFKLNYDRTENKLELDLEYINISPKILIEKYNYLNKFQRDISAKKFANNIIKKEISLGIMMKILWVCKEIVFVGYESGHVISYLISHNNDNVLDNKEKFNKLLLDLSLSIDDIKDDYIDQNREYELIEQIRSNDEYTTLNSNIKILSINSTHYPNPVLDIKYDFKNKLVFSSSAGSKLTIHSVSSSINDELMINEDIRGEKKFRINGISSIFIRNDGLVSISTWDGFVKLFKIITTDGDENNNGKSQYDLVEIDKIVKSKPRVVKEFSSDPNDPEITKNEKNIKRFKSDNISLNYISINMDKSSDSQRFIQKFHSEITLRNTATLQLLKIRKEKNISKELFLFIGYADGRIAMYKTC
ncbi:Asa1p ASCRUDRAFT_75259 [Ascoidea rubescens DSM 1968]|uniref:WD40 repeat-like protein n=1 Tax=Ascoidea rubescens DSM 1968 TaxID=1344418 RepID=A0A1D2VKH2_9ASCO|nr:hypothetical protein ASCRUDRAFT_75259 [Ascoidea rubescens DSM 1968]ODV62037.1 hypothetical protein ASCRUDRAFT_75259 [Ascoidea rubescens DSM 1968]